MIRESRSDSISDEEFLKIYKGVIKRKSSGKPRPKIIWFLLLALISMGIYFAVKRRTNPEFDIPKERALFEELPEQAKQAFIKKYGQPDDDDRECYLYYLVANSTMKRPCFKCPIWCADLNKLQILVSEEQVYYIGKTCREEGNRENEHQQIINGLDLEYEWVSSGSEGYITTQEQLHLKTYYLRPESKKEGCQLFLPPGNKMGMSTADWKKLLKELK